MGDTMFGSDGQADSRLKCELQEAMAHLASTFAYQGWSSLIQLWLPQEGGTFLSCDYAPYVLVGCSERLPLLRCLCSMITRSPAVFQSIGLENLALDWSVHMQVLQSGSPMALADCQAVQSAGSEHDWLLTIRRCGGRAVVLLPVWAPEHGPAPVAVLECVIDQPCDGGEDLRIKVDMLLKKFVKSMRLMTTPPMSIFSANEEAYPPSLSRAADAVFAASSPRYGAVSNSNVSSGYAGGPPGHSLPPELGRNGLAPAASHEQGRPVGVPNFSDGGAPSSPLPSALSDPLPAHTRGMLSLDNWMEPAPVDAGEGKRPSIPASKAQKVGGSSLSTHVNQAQKSLMSMELDPRADYQHLSIKTDIGGTGSRGSEHAGNFGNGSVRGRNSVHFSEPLPRRRAVGSRETNDSLGPLIHDHVNSSDSFNINHYDFGPFMSTDGLPGVTVNRGSMASLGLPSMGIPDLAIYEHTTRDNSPSADSEPKPISAKVVEPPRTSDNEESCEPLLVNVGPLREQTSDAWYLSSDEMAPGKPVGDHNKNRSLGITMQLEEDINDLSCMLPAAAHEQKLQQAAAAAEAAQRKQAQLAQQAQQQYMPTESHDSGAQTITPQELTLDRADTEDTRSSGWTTHHHHAAAPTRASQRASVAARKAAAAEVQAGGAPQGEISARCEMQSRVTIEVLQREFGKSLKDAAASIGISPTTLKRACRKLGVKRWPRSQRVAALEKEAMSTPTAGC